MKNLLTILIFSILFTSCADNKIIDGKKYRPYGLINESNYKNDSIHYEVSFGAAVSGVIFIEMIIPPLYTYGYNLYEPICKQSDFIKDNKGIIK